MVIASHILMYENLHTTTQSFPPTCLSNWAALTRTKFRTRSQTYLLICLITTFLALTWSTLVNVTFPLLQDWFVIVEIKPDIQGELEMQAQREIKKSLALNFMLDWNLTVSSLLSDSIVVWRAWALFQQERPWKIALAILMIINIGINISDCILDVISVGAIVSNSSTILDWISLVVSLVVNIFATGLIAWKAWNYHRAMKEASVHKRTRAQNILLLLIESGAIYCMIQALYFIFILLIVYGPGNNALLLLAENIISAMFTLASAWYPIAVVILVNVNKSPVIETFHIGRIQVIEGSHQEGYGA
ncbi:hypothetical protein GYMLUDRAFT_35508 [Collybiopsis luxurians FD-317 M1]|nr:hypothetical protein GYMLUDRAFT_35508 [Collybiopsis luxurians FD-317 M1]